MSKNVEEYLWRRVSRYLRFLSFVPFLRFVGVCNNLAFGVVDEKSDIDLFIIAKRGRLFIVRSFVTLILQFLGVRRHGKKIAGRFCLSFFVDDGCLDFSSIAIERDIYLSFWIKNMRTVIDDGVGDEFLSSNLWIKSFVYFDESALDKSRLIKKNLFGFFVQRFFVFLLGSRFGNFVEKRLSIWQLKRAEKKKSTSALNASIIISENMLKFHNLDRREFYRDKIYENFGDNPPFNEDQVCSVIK